MKHHLQIKYIYTIARDSTGKGNMKKNRKYELKSIEGVESVHPIVVTAGAARFENGKSAGITLIGVEAPTYAGGPWNLSVGKKSDMLQDGAIITDYFDLFIA